VAVAASVPHGRPPWSGVGLLLSGILAEPPELLDHVNDVGAHVVADDLSCGWRRVLPPSTLPDAHERWVDSLMAGPPDPTRGDPVQFRVDDLVARSRASGARGVLVYDLTFCEPELFYVPLLRERLGAAGLPMLHVETEVGGALPTQTMTRIEAFVETLS
jgi:benzoyl-CoA reductase/2-hydroxyglutaryl-CoA dehydratase subunit BcrC/BadD/HgdB